MRRIRNPPPGIRAAMRALWLELVHRHGSALSDAEIEKVLEGDLELNTQGLMVWLQRLGRHEPLPPAGGTALGSSRVKDAVVVQA